MPGPQKSIAGDPCQDRTIQDETLIPTTALPAQNAEHRGNSLGKASGSFLQDILIFLPGHHEVFTDTS